MIEITYKTASGIHTEQCENTYKACLFAKALGSLSIEDDEVDIISTKQEDEK